MSRWIDADKLHYIKVYITHDYDSAKSDIVVFAREIDKLAKKTTDVVEVVRCKDCKYGNEFKDENRFLFRLCSRHYGHGMMVEDYGFCKWGERREDGAIHNC